MSDHVQHLVHDTPELDCLDWSGQTVYQDFRDDLVRDGYCVVPGISREKAAGYVDDIHEWLESFGLGYKRDDPSTIRDDCLPIIHAKGMIQGYGAPHEEFTWRMRSEDSLIKIWETLHGTKDLLVSFDGINVSLPRKDIEPTKPWPHQDQDPDRGVGFRCVQGFVNLLPNGPDDGGLMVLRGAHRLSAEYHQYWRGREDRGFRWTNEIYVFQPHGERWLEERGCEWVKVNANPGDLVLWDSRTPHYNRPPVGNMPRFAIYTCYGPVSAANREDLETKKALFEAQKGHSHWFMGLQPYIEAYLAPKRDGVPDPLNTWKPRKPPVLSEAMMRYTGIPYISSKA